VSWPACGARLLGVLLAVCAGASTATAEEHYAPLRSFERGVAIYKGAFEAPGRVAAVEVHAGHAQGWADVGVGTYRWHDADGTTRKISGVGGRAGLSLEVIRLDGRTAAFVVPTQLGTFTAHIEGSASAGLRAGGSAAASWSKGSLVKAEGSAGAFVEGELALPVEIDLGGVRIMLEGRVTGSLGAGVEGHFEAEVDLASGRLRVSSDLGAVLGVGGGVGFSFDIDVGPLMSWLGIGADPEEAEESEEPSPSPTREPPPGASEPPQRSAPKKGLADLISGR
jgi:hypothetical protein